MLPGSSDDRELVRATGAGSVNPKRHHGLPDTRIRLRADSGFGDPALYDHARQGGPNN